MDVFVFSFAWYLVFILELDGSSKVEATAVKGLSSDTVCVEAQFNILQTTVGEQQAIHSGATNCGEM